MDTNKIIENGKIDEKEEEEIDLDKSVMDVEISGYESAQSQDESDVVFPKEEEHENHREMKKQVHEEIKLNVEKKQLTEFKKQVHEELKTIGEKKQITEFRKQVHEELKLVGEKKQLTEFKKQVHEELKEKAEKKKDTEVEIEEKVDEAFRDADPDMFNARGNTKGMRDLVELYKSTEAHKKSFMSMPFEERTKTIDSMHQQMELIYERLKNGDAKPTAEEARTTRLFTDLENIHWKLRMQEKMKDMSKEEKMEFLKQTNDRVNKLHLRLKNGEKLDRKTMSEEDKETMGFLKMTLQINEKAQQDQKYRLVLEVTTPSNYKEGALVPMILPQSANTPPLENNGLHVCSLSPPKGAAPGSKFRVALDFREMMGVPIPVDHVPGNPVKVMIGGNIPLGIQVPRNLKAHDVYWLHKSMILNSIKNLKKKAFAMKSNKEAAAGASVLKKDVEDVAMDEKKKVLVDEKKNVVVDEKKNTAAPVESNTVKKKKKKKMKKVGSYKEDLLILSGVLGLGLAAYWAWTSMSAPRRRRR